MSLLGAIRAMLRRTKERAPDVAPEAARERVDAGAFVLDVREAFEHDRGCLPGAVNVPLGDLEGRLDAIPKDRPVVVHCWIGSRGARAAALLKEKGFTDVVNVEGGIRAWEKAGLDVEKPKG